MKRESSTWRCGCGLDNPNDLKKCQFEIHSKIEGSEENWKCACMQRHQIGVEASCSVCQVKASEERMFWRCSEGYKLLRKMTDEKC